MEAVRTICSDIQCLMDLFVNYDLSGSETKMFEILVNVVCKLASPESIDIENTSEITSRICGIEMLTTIMKSMEEICWQPQGMFKFYDKVS